MEKKLKFYVVMEQDKSSNIPKEMNIKFAASSLKEAQIIFAKYIMERQKKVSVLSEENLKNGINVFFEGDKKYFLSRIVKTKEEI